MAAGMEGGARAPLPSDEDFDKMVAMYSGQIGLFEGAMEEPKQQFVFGVDMSIPKGVEERSRYDPFPGWMDAVQPANVGAQIADALRPPAAYAARPVTRWWFPWMLPLLCADGQCRKVEIDLVPISPGNPVGRDGSFTRMVTPAAVLERLGESKGGLISGQPSVVIDEVTIHQYNISDIGYNVAIALAVGKGEERKTLSLPTPGAATKTLYNGKVLGIECPRLYKMPTSYPANAWLSRLALLSPTIEEGFSKYVVGSGEFYQVPAPNTVYATTGGTGYSSQPALWLLTWLILQYFPGVNNDLLLAIQGREGLGGMGIHIRAGHMVPAAFITREVSNSDQLCARKAYIDALLRAIRRTVKLSTIFTDITSLGITGRILLPDGRGEVGLLSSSMKMTLTLRLHVMCFNSDRAVFYPDITPPAGGGETGGRLTVSGAAPPAGSPATSPPPDSVLSATALPRGEGVRVTGRHLRTWA